MKVGRRILSFVAIVGLVGSSVSSAFSDVGKEHWAYEKIELMQEKGVVSGFEDETFRPEEKITREQFASILVKTLDLKAPSKKITFEDVAKDRWSKDAIEYSSQYLTAYESNGKYYFRPEASAVREDMAVAVVKAKGLQNEVANNEILNRFLDKSLISESAKKYVALAVEHGFMSGNADGTFNPLGTLTRAEVTALMCNVMNKVVLDDVVGKKNEIEMPKLDGKVLDLGKDWEKFEIATDRAVGNGRGGAPGAWYIPAGQVVTLDKLYVSQGKVHPDSTAEKIFVKYDGKIIREFTVWANADKSEPTEMPRFDGKVLDLGKDWEKFEIATDRATKTGRGGDYGNWYTPAGRIVTLEGLYVSQGEVQSDLTAEKIFVKYKDKIIKEFEVSINKDKSEPIEMPKFDGKALDLGKDWEKFEIATDRSVGSGRGGEHGDWYSPAGRVVTLERLYIWQGKVQSDSTAEKVFVKYNGEIIKEFEIPGNKEVEIEKVPSFQLDVEDMTIDFGKNYSKYEVSYSDNERPGAWYKVAKDFNNPTTIVTEGTKLSLRRLNQIGNINYVFARLIGNTSIPYYTIEIPSDEKIPRFQLDTEDMTIDFGDDYSKYEVSYGTDRRPGSWYRVIKDFNNPSTIVTEGTKLSLRKLEQIENIDYVFVRLIGNTDIRYRTIKIPSDEKIPRFQLNTEDMTIDFGEDYSKYEVSYSDNERPGAWYRVAKDFNNPSTIVTEGTKLSLRKLDQQMNNINYVFARLIGKTNMGYRTIEIPNN